jgi:hypothetical protein
MEGDYMELETLGTLERLEPGEMVAHREEWRVCAGLDSACGEDERRLEDALSELAVFEGGPSASR